jgi:hypothetical protein
MDEDFQYEWEAQDTPSELQNCCQPVSQQSSPIQCVPCRAPEPRIFTQRHFVSLLFTSYRMSASFQNISSLLTPSYFLMSAERRKRQHSEIWTSSFNNVYLDA